MGIYGNISSTYDATEGNINNSVINGYYDEINGTLSHLGIKGNPGYSPIKGKDYWTLEEQNEIKEETKNLLSQDINQLTEIANRAESIAKSKATAYVFDTLEDLENKLSDKDFIDNLVIGDNLYIRALNTPDYWWDGVQKQILETEKPDFSNYIKDVQINNQSIVIGNMARIPIAGINNLGVVKIDSDLGVKITTDGRLSLNPATNYIIDQHIDINAPITVGNMDYAIRASLCDGKQEEWSEKDQLAARSRIGAISINDIEGITNKTFKLLTNYTFTSLSSQVEFSFDIPLQELFIICNSPIVNNVSSAIFKNQNNQTIGFWTSSTFDTITTRYIFSHFYNINGINCVCDTKYGNNSSTCSFSNLSYHNQWENLSKLVINRSAGFEPNTNIKVYGR